MNHKPSSRPGWAVAATILSILAIAITMAMTDFSYAGYLAPFCFLPVMLLVNERLLEGRKTPGKVRVLKLACIGTVPAIVIALVYSLAFLPFIPISFFLLLYAGSGVGLWTPFLDLFVLIFQLRALRAYLRLCGDSGALPLRLVSGFGAALLVCGVTILVMPPDARHTAFERAPGHEALAYWWGLMHGQSPFGID